LTALDAGLTRTHGFAIMGASRSFNSFRIISLLTAALYVFLFVSLFFFPDSIMEGAGIQGGEMAYFMARRTSMLMLSFAVLLILVSGAERSRLRAIIGLIVAFNMTGFASTGISEYALGRIDSHIRVSVCVELTVSALFAVQSFSDLRKIRQSA